MAGLNIVEKVIALEGVELLKNLTPEQLSRIASIAREVKHPPNKVILDPSIPMDALLVVVDGSVELSRDGEVLHTAVQNDVLGAWALFDNDPMPVTAKTVEDTRLLRIGRDDFYDLLSDNVEITAAIFSTLVKRFRKLVWANDGAGGGGDERASVSQDPDPVELEQLRAKVASLTAQLTEEYKMASIGRLLASIVHEINSPIGSILSNNQVVTRSLELLKSALASGDAAALAKAGRMVETCLSLTAIDKIACERISDVVRGLKTFVRVDTSQMRQVNLNDQIQDTLKLTQAEFRQRIKVDTDFGELPPVQCHANMLNQVFLNILVNAGQAIQGEGKITVRSRHEGKSVHISIADTGPGIKPEDRPKIFAGGFTTKAVGVGTGLGLALSKKIVEEIHAGSLSFESEVGVGTTFHIVVPVEQAKQG